ncbi:hypothetical protein D0Y65_039799 [Glycine soja]|uniref:DUF8040 domain-containing protein n=1 Tax=Glycine soja TaxID=3848 RepID=A0A445GNB9_GLYSO|nr:hypothetical protein D0Y65_039799 [Glycine soja]
MMRGEHIERPLTRRQITSQGYDYIHKALNDDPAIFRQVYRMYPDVFRKLCTIIREKTPLEDTRFICVEEMLASFLQIVGQNTRYRVIRNTFGRSQFATSENFHKILKALNSLAPDLMVRPGSTVPAKIRESTRFYPYFKDCIGAIDGTHIPASVKGRDVSSYRDHHGNISQNVLAACSDEFPVEPTDESSSSSSVLPNYEDNDHEPIVQTQEQEREDVNIWRTNIGSDMWRNANN